jgi:hypothetical protein
MFTDWSSWSKQAKGFGFGVWRVTYGSFHAYTIALGPFTIYLYTNKKS